MAFRQVTNNVLDIKKQEGVSYEATYHGKRNIETKIGPQVVWQFVDADGKIFGIYGFTNLNRAMESLSDGTLVRITYQGTKNIKTKYGLKDVHQVLVEADDGENEAGA